LALRVPARGNSTTCPSCRFRTRKNRRRDLFHCVECGHTDDADHVGALAAKRHGEDLYAEGLAAWEKQCSEAEVARERRKAAAKKRGLATAEKWRRKREAEATGHLEERRRETSSEKQGSSIRGAQSPAARIPSGFAPIRDRTCGGAPENVGGSPPAEENS